MQALLAAVWRRIVPDREISAKKVEMSRKCPVCARCGQQAEEMATRETEEERRREKPARERGARQTRKAYRVPARLSCIVRPGGGSAGLLHLLVEFVHGRQHFQRRVPADERGHEKVQGHADGAFEDR